MSSELAPDLPQVDFDAVGPPIGVRLPDIVLPDQHGHPVDFHAYRGDRPGMLVVHRSADW